MEIAGCIKSFLRIEIQDSESIYHYFLLKSKYQKNLEANSVYISNLT